MLAGDTEPEDFAGGVVGGVYPSGSVTFDIGVTTANITVAVAGDTVFEPDEAFRVQLSNPVNCSIGTATASSTVFNEPANFVAAAAQHMIVTVEPRDVTAPPSTANCWIKRMFIVAWRIAGSPGTSTAMLLEEPAENAWWGFVGPDGSMLQPKGLWFASMQELQEAYLARWQELWDEGELPDSRLSSTMILRRATDLRVTDTVRLDDGLLWVVESVTPGTGQFPWLRVRFSRTIGDTKVLELRPDDLVLLADG